MYESLESYIRGIRNNFDYYIQAVQTLSGKKYFKSITLKSRKRVMFFDEILIDEVSFEGAKKMKNYVFFVILDHLISNLNVRKVSFSKINKILDSLST